MNRAGIGPKDTGQSAQGSSAAGWRESKWLALCELAIVVLIFIADWRHLIPFSKTPFILKRMRAPIFRSFSRIVVRWALANSVPQAPIAVASGHAIAARTGWESEVASERRLRGVLHFDKNQ